MTPLGWSEQQRVARLVEDGRRALSALNIPDLERAQRELAASQGPTFREIEATIAKATAALPELQRNAAHEALQDGMRQLRPTIDLDVIEAAARTVERLSRLRGGQLAGAEAVGLCVQEGDAAVDRSTSFQISRATRDRLIVSLAALLIGLGAVIRAREGDAGATAAELGEFCLVYQLLVRLVADRQDATG